MERIVSFAGPAPTWDSLQQAFTQAGLTASVRMIDGLPAFPDEMPADGWQEVRIGVSGGMMTLRLMPGRLAVVVWGNADDNQRRDWETVAQACARAANGSVSGADSPKA
jgi:hypothetical protein